MQKKPSAFSRRHSLAWFAFAAGGTLAALFLPATAVFMMILMLAPDRWQQLAKSITLFDRVEFHAVLLFCALLVLWHGVHRLHLMFHDLQNDFLKKHGSRMLYLIFVMVSIWGIFNLFDK